MEYKNLTDKQKIPVLGLGTWHMGGNFRPDYSDDKKYISAIEYALERGITHIDSAEIYSGGHAEELVGQAIKGIDRKNLFLTTKVSPFHLGHDAILLSCEASRKRIGVDYIDLYLVHWPNPLASMQKAMAAFDSLVADGSVRFIGLSNFSAKQFAKAQSYTKNKLVCNQIHYNLLYRKPEQEMLSFCEQEKVILTAYSPLAEGKIVKRKIPELETIAKKYGKTPVQVALRWLIEKPQVITIPKATSKEHIDGIVGTLGWKLSEEDQEVLNKIS